MNFLPSVLRTAYVNNTLNLIQRIHNFTVGTRVHQQLLYYCNPNYLNSYKIIQFPLI